ncbi:histidine kinase [Nibricoccus aquaticus]|uniref:Histidine kinase n=1 Tax=Nibricoccus aquaticus TaxID=2576891 RepID=A0A290QFX0_9BACT|nr:HDOD domain-containing protein [Nibricoccus aquaticus]ATC64238.1 histidine kinase [Nibricoccus aquaticus]
MSSTSPITTTTPTKPPFRTYTDAEIMRRIDACPKLASLQSINRALAGLVNSEQSYNSQIAEIIRRDPSLTARLLRMVNSVYFGLTAKVNNIEEAVFYLGLRQIRELSMATPVIEELEKINRTSLRLPWKDLWKHSIGSAIMTREILATTTLLVDDDTDYIIGLLHNVGKVVLASAFPDEFAKIFETQFATPVEVCVRERELIGWDHARIGGYYLQRHQLSAEITDAVYYHNDPAAAPDHSFYAAAVQVADQLVRFAGIPGGFEKVDPIPEDAWLELPGWKILYGTEERETRLARAALSNSVQRLPTVLSGLV